MSFFSFFFPSPTANVLEVEVSPRNVAVWEGGSLKPFAITFTLALFSSNDTGGPPAEAQRKAAPTHPSPPPAAPVLYGGRGRQIKSKK